MTFFFFFFFCSMYFCTSIQVKSEKKTIYLKYSNTLFFFTRFRLYSLSMCRKLLDEWQIVQIPVASVLGLHSLLQARHSTVYDLFDT